MPENDPALKRRDAAHADKATLESHLRLSALEDVVKEIRQVAQNAHTDVAAIGERIAGITDWQRRQNGDISAMVTSFNNLSATLNEKLDGIKTQISSSREEHNKEISVLKEGHEKDMAKICGEYDDRLESLAIATLKQQAADRDKLQRWLIGLMGTIIGGLILTIVSIRIGF
jgi:predicted  nucleic acid-binding Zn-ribbon protein